MEPEREITVIVWLLPMALVVVVAIFLLFFFYTG